MSTQYNQKGHDVSLSPSLPVNEIIFANGIYDILCSVCIVFFPDTVWARMHADLFVEQSRLLHRFLAYWIFTYGIIRISVIDKNSRSIPFLVIATYVHEGLVFLLEPPTLTTSVLFVAAVSLWLACCKYRHVLG